MKKKSAIIIGSGVAGLAIATRLALQGFHVKVFEKNAYPGGKLSMFEQDGYRFDAGPSLFTQPVNLQELFKDAGENIDEFFSYRPVDVACRYFFDNGKTFTAYAEPVKFASEMELAVGEPAAHTTNYMADAKNLYNHVGSIFLNYSLHKKNTWLNKRVIHALRFVKSAYLFRNLQQYNRRRFKTAEAVQVFNRFATYNGSNPYKAPAMLSLIPHLEINEGVFYPHGGMISITNALFQLAKKKGVEFHFNAPVETIIHADNAAIGIVTGGENIYTDLVVSNGDIYFTYKHLLRQPTKAKKILKHERSSSALIFYWGIGKTFDSLDLHNIFFSNNYKQEFDHIFNQRTLGDDPTVYVNITCKEDPTDAPAGKENWFVMINVPANSGQDWDTLKVSARKNIIAKLNRLLQEDIESLIESETIMDPVIIEERTGSFMGSLYGTSSNKRMAAFLRSPNFSTEIKNLYFCGGSVHPGGGIPLCLKSAAITAAIIQKDQQRHRATH
jgi:phytoene desaturase